MPIDVAAAALHFRDIMATSDLLPALAYERSAFGKEGSGIVRRVGMDAREFRPGDEVVFITSGSITTRGQLFGKPRCLGMEEVASVLSVYVTTYYSLIHLARLREGQRVLIHSGMGGVG